MEQTSTRVQPEPISDCVVGNDYRQPKEGKFISEFAGICLTVFCRKAKARRSFMIELTHWQRPPFPDDKIVTDARESSYDLDIVVFAERKY